MDFEFVRAKIIIGKDRSTPIFPRGKIAGISLRDIPDEFKKDFVSHLENSHGGSLLNIIFIEDDEDPVVAFGSVEIYFESIGVLTIRGLDLIDNGIPKEILIFKDRDAFKVWHKITVH